MHDRGTVAFGAGPSQELTITVSDGTNQLAGAVVGANTPNVWQFEPTTALPANATITASLSSAITDFSANALVPVSISFTTAP